jgi:DHA1 family bicyclomycin/chloramphenicol resistance-like MFS transporter
MAQIKSVAAVKPIRSAKQPLSFPEFVALMAFMTAMTALSIDAMLPALGDIARELGAQRVNDSQLVISLIFLGLSIGQIFYGPLSDSTGRKPAIYLGIGIYIISSAVSWRSLPPIFV